MNQLKPIYHHTRLSHKDLLIRVKSRLILNKLNHFAKMQLVKLILVIYKDVLIGYIRQAYSLENIEILETNTHIIYTIIFQNI